MAARIIEVGIVCLLIITPLAYGSVTPFMIAFIEVMSMGLLLTWLVNILFIERKSGVFFQGSGSRFLQQHLRNPFSLAISIFFGLILLQQIPLPVSVLEIISPSSYALYAEALTQIHHSFPKAFPISACSSTTTTEWYKLLAYGAIFFLLITLIKTPRQIKRLIITILIIGFVEAFYGLLQYFSGYHRLYSFRTSTWVHGTFVNKNHFAGYMELVLPFVFAMLFTRFKDQDAARKISYGDGGRHAHTLFLLTVVFCMISALLLTGSRGGLLSFTFGMVWLFVLTLLRRRLRKWSMLVLIFASMTAALIIMTNSALFTRQIGSLQELDSDTSFYVRQQLWKSALHIFQDYPLLGSGLGAYAHLSSQYRPFLSNTHFHHPENDYLQFLAETGIVGSVLILFVISLFFYRILRTWKQRRSRWAIAIGAGGFSSMASLLCHSAMDFNLHIPSNALLFTVIAALTYVAVHLRQSTVTREARSTNSITTSRRRPTSPSNSTSSHIHVPIRRRAIILCLKFSLCCLPLLYLWQVTNMYYAFLRYQDFEKQIEHNQFAPDEHDRHSLQNILREVLRYAPHNPQYTYALGNFLYQEALTQPSPLFSLLNEAEYWFKQTILQDPANPWSYYQLGRLSQRRGDCPYWNESFFQQHTASCVPAQYFLHALRHAPNNLFLQQEISRWFYAYQPETGLRLIHDLHTKFTQEQIRRPSIIRHFARFLYDMHMDYASDQKEFVDVLNPRVTGCQLHILAHGTRGIELGNDDGIPDWYAPLISESERIKKEICLPEHLKQYRYAALKVFMGTGGSRHFLTHIKVDDQLIATYSHTLPRQANWHEIPIDPGLLRGKSKINVYIRAEGTSTAGNFLRIGGDQHTPTTCSSLNFHQFSDLSPEKGKQQGEYLIRLVLKQ